MKAAALQRQALILALVVVVVWGCNFSVQKAAYSALSPGGFLFLRSVTMAVASLLLLHWRGRPWWPPMGREEWPALLRVTVLGQFGHVLLVTFGIHLSTAFSSALIFACGPVFTLLMLRVVGRGRLQREQVIGVAVAFAGVLLFMSDKFVGADWRASAGDLLMLGAALAFSAYTVSVTPMVERHGGIDMMCWTTLLATPGMLLVSAPAAWTAPYATAGLLPWAGAMWTILIAAFGGWIAWSWINAVRGVARTAPLVYLVPPVAGTVAWFAMGEAFGPLKIVGALVALAGVAWAQWRGGPAVPRPAAPAPAPNGDR